MKLSASGWQVLVKSFAIGLRLLQQHSECIRCMPYSTREEIKGFLSLTNTCLDDPLSLVETIIFMKTIAFQRSV